MNKQICIIHGGDTFDSNQEYLDALRDKEVVYERLLYSPGWRDWLASQLADWDVIAPSMPNAQNAQYSEWEIYFSKILPFLDASAVLVGHSLGGIFLAKFLSEHSPALPLSKLILIAAPYDDEQNESLGDFKVSSAVKLNQAAREIHIFHSTDDPVVPFAESSKYIRDLPRARLHSFEDRHHFIGQIFPELVEIIR